MEVFGGRVPLASREVRVRGRRRSYGGGGQQLGCRVGGSGLGPRLTSTPNESSFLEDREAFAGVVCASGFVATDGPSPLVAVVGDSGASDAAVTEAPLFRGILEG